MFRIRLDGKPYTVLSVKLIEEKTKFLIYKEDKFMWVDSSEAIMFESTYII